MPDATQLDRIEARLARVEQKLDTNLALARAELSEQFLMNANLDQITQQVAATADAEDAAILLLTDLHDRLVAAGTDAAALASLAQQLEQKKDQLAAAIVANTPSATPPA